MNLSLNLKHESNFFESLDRPHFNAYLAIEVSFNISSEKINWPDSIKKLVASLNLCESSTLEFLAKQFQNEFETLLRPPGVAIMSAPVAAPPIPDSDFPRNGWNPEPPPLPEFLSFEMPTFLPPPKLDTFMIRKSLEAKIVNFLKARENDFLFTLMFRRC